MVCRILMFVWPFGPINRGEARENGPGTASNAACATSPGREAQSKHGFIHPQVGKSV